MGEAQEICDTIHFAQMCYGAGMKALNRYALSLQVHRNSSALLPDTDVLARGGCGKIYGRRVGGGFSLRNVF